MIDAPDGNRYLTAGAVRRQHGYADITPALLRTWCHAGHLRPVSRAELAAAFNVPAGPDPHLPARVSGPSGPENVYRWADVVRAETRTRRAAAGRRRGRRRDTPNTLAA